MQIKVQIANLKFDMSSEEFSDVTTFFSSKLSVLEDSCLVSA